MHIKCTNCNNSAFLMSQDLPLQWHYKTCNEFCTVKAINTNKNERLIEEFKRRFCEIEKAADKENFQYIKKLCKEVREI